MNNIAPPTIGDVIRERFIEGQGMSEAECATRIGLPQDSFASLMRGEGGITAYMAGVMASRLGLTPDTWLRIQFDRDRWEELRESARHPGAYLREQLLAPAGLTIEGLADALGITTGALEPVLQEKEPLNAELAWRLSAAVGGTPQSWMEMQALYELISVRHRIDLASIHKMVFSNEESTENFA